MSLLVPQCFDFFFEIKVKVAGVGMEGFPALVEVLGGGNIKR